jgi:hypothetical protein
VKATVKAVIVALAVRELIPVPFAEWLIAALDLSDA